MAFNRKQKLRDNIEALRTAFILDRERRKPTARERLLLERFCGFGGLKFILNPAKELTDAVHWAKSDLELFAPTVELHRLIRENSNNDNEYKRYMDSLKGSVLTAFYTPAEITGTIADELKELTGQEIRVTIPGHYQRGGAPCPADRVLTSRFGVAAAQLILQKKFGYMVALQDNHIVPVPLTEVAGKLKTVPPDGELVKQARALGLSMGD